MPKPAARSGAFGAAWAGRRPIAEVHDSGGQRVSPVGCDAETTRTHSISARMQRSIDEAPASLTAISTEASSCEQCKAVPSVAIPAAAGGRRSRSPSLSATSRVRPSASASASACAPAARWPARRGER